MKLPNADLLVIDPRKLRDYVLSTEHPVGRFKAAFFAALGFDSTTWEELAVELRKLALAGRAETGERNAFGQKYLVHGRITGPGGRVVDVVTVWIILEGQEVPRLVTLYPEG